MSWDVVLINSKRKNAGPEDEGEPIALLFGVVLERYFDSIVKDGEHREIKGPDYSIDYFDDGEPSGSLMLSLYGEDALYPLIDLAIKNNWEVYDTGIGEMIDLENPANNGYDDFEAYRSQLLNRPSPKKQNWFSKLFKRNE